MKELDNNVKYLNNSRIYKEYYRDALWNTKLEVKIVPDGYVLPKSELYVSKGGVVDSNRNYIKESSVDNEGSYICINDGYRFQEYSEEYSDISVIYLGYFFRHWGHFLMDCTTRMWILLEEKYKDYKVVFPNHPENIRDGNYNRFLELLGLDENRIVNIDKPTRFREIIVPSEGRFSSRNLHSNEWYAIFDKVAENAKYDISNIPKKVYFSRSKFGKPELGEEEIQHNFEINGYTVVFPELLSLDEQIGIFQCAEEIVSQNSSICMNVVFAREGLKWLIINKYSVIHDNFTELRYKKKIDITYIDAYSEKLNKYGDMIGTLPYLISFNQNLKRYFDDHSMKYETYGIVYRVKNIVIYLYKCAVWPIRGRIKVLLPKIVRKMKREAPRLYCFLKKIEAAIK